MGVQTARLVERILEEKPHPEIGYRTCLGIIQLAKQYSPARMESTAALALRVGATTYKRVASILRNGLDTQSAPTTAESPSRAPSTPHENLRGPEYFQ